jgi:hypothetical protein
LQVHIMCIGCMEEYEVGNPIHMWERLLQSVEG